MIKIKRIYEKAEKSDGVRILVDRLWPRGMTKEKAQLYLWLKEVAPSTELRKWFNHEIEKWGEFKVRYQKELSNNPAFGKLEEISKKNIDITLLFAARDELHNEALVLKEYLETIV